MSGRVRATKLHSDHFKLVIGTDKVSSSMLVRLFFFIFDCAYMCSMQVACLLEVYVYMDDHKLSSKVLHLHEVSKYVLHVFFMLHPRKYTINNIN